MLQQLIYDQFTTTDQQSVDVEMKAGVWLCAVLCCAVCIHATQSVHKKKKKKKKKRRRTRCK